MLRLRGIATVIVGAGFGLVACNAILGIDDPTIVPGDAGVAADTTPKADAPVVPPDGSPTPDGARPTCGHGTPFETAKLVPGFEDVDVWSLRLSADEQTAYLAIPQSPLDATGFDLFTSAQIASEGKFGLRTKMSISTEHDDYWPTASADSLALFFESGTAADGGSSPSRIWFADRATINSNFTAKISDYFAQVPSNATEAAPYLAPSGKTLYWHSAYRPGGNDSLDLWGANISAQGVVSNDFKLPSGINTADQEQFPVVTADELELFFARGAPETVFASTRESTKVQFTTASEVTGGAQINTPNRQLPSWISPDSCRLYFIRVESIDGGVRARAWVASRQQR